MTLPSSRTGLPGRQGAIPASGCAAGNPCIVQESYEWPETVSVTFDIGSAPYNCGFLCDAINNNTYILSVVHPFDGVTVGYEVTLSPLLPSCGFTPGTRKLRFNVNCRLNDNVNLFFEAQSFTGTGTFISEFRVDEPWPLPAVIQFDDNSDSFCEPGQPITANVTL